MFQSYKFTQDHSVLNLNTAFQRGVAVKVVCLIFFTLTTPFYSKSSNNHHKFWFNSNQNEASEDDEFLANQGEDFQDLTSLTLSKPQTLGPSDKR